MGPAQSIPVLLTHRHRGQAPSHSGYRWPLDGCKTWLPSRGPLCSSQRRQTCGRGLPPMGPAQSIPVLLTHCYRGQAPSHLGYRWPLDGCKTGRPSRGPLCTSQRRQTCGRGLAPDGACSVDTWVADPPPSGASPLPPWVTAGLRTGARPGRSFDAVVKGIAHRRHGHGLAINDPRLVAEGVGRRQ